MRDGWAETTLGEVAVLNPKESALSVDSPFIPMDAVHVGKRYIQYHEPRGDRSGARANTGDVLFARITPCLENGKVAQIQNGIERCGGSTEFIVIRGTNVLDSDFAYFWATWSDTRNRAAGLMTGTTGRQRLSASDLGAMTVSLPPLVEQKRIVDVVSSVDVYIDALRQQADTARTARSAVLHELLSAGGDDWTETTLGDVATWGSGGTPKSGEPAYYDGDIPWCVIGDLTEGEVFLTEKCITSEGLKNSSAKIVEPGAVMIAMYGASIGRTGIVGQPMATNQAIAFAYPSGETLENRFLLSFLQTQKSQFVEAGQGAAQPNISQTVLKAWPILLPPLDEQKRIVEIVSSMDDVIQATEQAVADAKNLRSGLLSGLLSGEYEIPESYDKFMEAA